MCNSPDELWVNPKENGAIGGGWHNACVTPTEDAKVRYVRADLVADYLDRARDLCLERADILDDFGLESECCAATARNCATDIEDISRNGDSECGK